MSSSFKKIIPVLAILLVFSGIYLLSEFTGDSLGGSVHVESVAKKAQEVQGRLNFLTTVSGFENTIRDARLDTYASINRDPAPEDAGRKNPFILR